MNKGMEGGQTRRESSHEKRHFQGFGLRNAAKALVGGNDDATRDERSRGKHMTETLSSCISTV